MHRTTTGMIGLLAAGALLTGCSSSSHDSATDEPGTTSPSTQAAAATAPPPAPVAPKYKVGQSWPFTSPTGATGRTTVLGYQQPVPHVQPPDTSLGVPAGSTWGRLDLRVCQTDGPSIGVSQTPWSVAFADGSRAESTGLDGGDFPKPEWPEDAAVQPGECVRGGIMLPIPKGQRPVAVVYAPESEPVPIEWAIPAVK